MADQPHTQKARGELPRSLSGVKHIIAIGSGKGGVGKSTVAVNLAMALKQSGAAVGLMDADIYGPSQPGMLGAGSGAPRMTEGFILPVERHGLLMMSIGVLMEADRPVIWRAPIANKMIQQFLENVLWGQLDYLLIDLPPGTGDVQLTLAQQAHLTGAVIVTTPQQVALGVAKKGLQMFEQVNVPILGIIENMSGFVCPHCQTETAIFKSGGGAKMADTFDVNFLGSIPLDPALMSSGDDGLPFFTHNGDSPTSRAFATIAERLVKIVSEGIFVEDEPTSIEIGPDGGLVITWPDGQVGRLSAHDLRLSCRCAMCVDEESGERTLDPRRVPLGIKIEAVSRVGRYALTCAFSDGHNTGIFGYDLLKEISRKRNDASAQSFSV